MLDYFNGIIPNPAWNTHNTGQFAWNVKDCCKNMETWNPQLLWPKICGVGKHAAPTAEALTEREWRQSQRKRNSLCDPEGYKCKLCSSFKGGEFILSLCSSLHLLPTHALPPPTPPSCGMWWCSDSLASVLGGAGYSVAQRWGLVQE